MIKLVQFKPLRKTKIRIHYYKYSPAINNTSPALRSDTLSRAMLNTNSETFHSPEINYTYFILPPLFQPKRLIQELHRSVTTKFKAACGVRPTRTACKSPLTFHSGSRQPPSLTAALIIDTLPVIWSPCPAAYSMEPLSQGTKQSQTPKLMPVSMNPGNHYKGKKSHLMMYSPNS